MSNIKSLVKTTAITLSWEAVAGATKYELQSSLYIDFSVLDINQNALVNPTYDATIGDGQGKYYWRWRPYVASAWLTYREVNSFIYNSSMGSDVIPTAVWRLITKNTSPNIEYLFEVNPLDWEITPENIYKTQERNLNGDLLSEYVTTKSKILLDFSKQSYIGLNMKAELYRLYHLHSSFYLTFQFDDLNYINKVSKIWEVEFMNSFQIERIGGLILEFAEV